MQHLIFPINALPSIQLVDSDFLDIHFSPERKAEAAARYYSEIDADVMFYFSDVVIQAEAMGAGISYSRHRMPRVASPASKIEVPRPHRCHRMRANARTLRRMERDFPRAYRAALVYGPFTVAGQIAGEQRLLRMLSEAPLEAEALLEKCSRLAARYRDYLLNNGADLFWISDPLAGLLPPEQYTPWAGDPVRELFAASPGAPRILHVCGDTSHILPGMVATDADGISFDNCMELLLQEEMVPETVSLVGNLDPVLVQTQPHEEIRKHTSDLAQLMGPLQHFCLSTGCALPPDTPVESVAAFVDSGQEALDRLKPWAADMLQIHRAVHLGRGNQTNNLIRSALERGAEPLSLLTSGLSRAIRKASARYESKLCYLPELLLIVEAFYEGFSCLEQRLRERPFRGTVVLGTVRGDIHEIGKNLVRVFLETSGYRVIDLGADVSPEAFRQACEEQSPDLVGLSGFTSPSRLAMRETIRSIRNSPDGECISIMVGGAAVNPSRAGEMGSDGYARDAVEAMRVANALNT
ncbi:MAG: cobalamin-dependent protein [Desulfohalobiaceae bacterium]|nr:cobalamin-dependent protein [Desulfohalobiaceae bacterium]